MEVIWNPSGKQVDLYRLGLWFRTPANLAYIAVSLTSRCPAGVSKSDSAWYFEAVNVGQKKRLVLDERFVSESVLEQCIRMAVFCTQRCLNCLSIDVTSFRWLESESVGSVVCRCGHVTLRPSSLFPRHFATMGCSLMSKFGT
jgi:hypothetical protein